LVEIEQLAVTAGWKYVRNAIIARYSTFNRIMGNICAFVASLFTLLLTFKRVTIKAYNLLNLTKN